MAESPSAERERLLGLVADYFLENGVSDVSLSALARDIGSNNRMLLYYFGTKEKLFDEAGQAALARFPGISGLMDEFHSEGEIEDILERAWLRIASDESRPFVRLFFENFWLSARRPAFEAGYLMRVEAWKHGVAGLLRRHGFEFELAEQLGVSIVSMWRGLQLELVAGTDPEQLRVAHRRALEMMLSAAVPATAS